MSTQDDLTALIESKEAERDRLVVEIEALQEARRICGGDVPLPWGADAEPEPPPRRRVASARGETSASPEKIAEARQKYGPLILGALEGAPQEGMTKKMIAKLTGVPEGTLGTAFAALVKTDEIVQTNKPATMKTRWRLPSPVGPFA